MCVFVCVRARFPVDGALATVDVGLAYRDDTLSEWTEMAHSLEQRKLSCNFTTARVRTSAVISCFLLGLLLFLGGGGNKV